MHTIMKHHRILRNASLTIAFMCVSLLLSPARATDDEGDSVGASSVNKTDGASTISVSVSYTSVSNGGGAATSTTATGTVAPLCDYSSTATGADLAHDIRKPPTHPGAQVPKEKYPDWEQHENEPGQWYYLNCHRDRASSEEEYIKARDDAESRPAVWVPDGEDPPAPEVDGETLAQAAWDAVDIPTPSIGTNPALGDSGATVVGLDTWVWADGDTPATVTATATAGPVTATVTATASGLSLSAPDSTPHCSGFGTPWQPGMAEGSSDCTIVFGRASAHRASQTTPLRTSATYDVSYTATDGSSGALDPVTVTSTTELPVTEIQTVNVPTPNH